VVQFAALLAEACLIKGVKVSSGSNRNKRSVLRGGTVASQASSGGLISGGLRLVLVVVDQIHGGLWAEVVSGNEAFGRQRVAS